VDGRRRAGALRLRLAERGGDAVEGLGDGRAGGGGEDDLWCAGAYVDRPVYLTVADELFGGGGVGDSGDLERVGKALGEAALICLTAGAGPATAIGTSCTDERTEGQAKAVSNTLTATVSTATARATAVQGDGDASAASWA
jgi:hypothetical protein